MVRVAHEKVSHIVVGLLLLVLLLYVLQASDGQREMPIMGQKTDEER